VGCAEKCASNTGLGEGFRESGLGLFISREFGEVFVRYCRWKSGSRSSSTSYWETKPTACRPTAETTRFVSSSSWWSMHCSPWQDRMEKVEGENQRGLRQQIRWRVKALPQGRRASRARRWYKLVQKVKRMYECPQQTARSRCERDATAKNSGTTTRLYTSDARRHTTEGTGLIDQSIFQPTSSGSGLHTSCKPRFEALRQS
jgi:hypothetical protein